MSSIRTLSLAVTLTIAGLTSAQAQTVVYTTLAATVPSTGAYTCIGSTTAVSAVEVLTPVGTPYQLTRATAYMYLFATGNPNVTLNVHADNGGEPGAVVGTLGTQAGGVQNAFAAYAYTFTPAAPVVLSPATNYWVVASSPVADACGFGWHFPGQAPSGVFTYVNERQYTDSWQDRAGNHQSLELVATEAPLPAAIQSVPTLSGWALLLLLSMVGGVALRNLRRV